MYIDQNGFLWKNSGLANLSMMQLSNQSMHQFQQIFSVQQQQQNSPNVKDEPQKYKDPQIQYYKPAESVSQQTLPLSMPRKQKLIKNKKEESSIKNAEPNIINQLFSFFNHESKSKKLVLRAIKRLKRFNEKQIQTIKNMFYSIVGYMNMKKGRKYVNKNTILNYYTSRNLSQAIPGIKQKLQEVNLISLKEFCSLFRVCTYAYLQQESIPAVLTSKRVLMIDKKEHLNKRRFIVSVIEQYYQ